MLARMEDITVVIADDHAVVRKGLRLLVDAEADLRVVAEAGTVPDALRMAGAHRPAVIVLDLNMPGGSSLDAIPTMLEQAPTTAVVVLTMQDEPSFAGRRCRPARPASSSRRPPTTSCSARSAWRPRADVPQPPRSAPGSRPSRRSPPARRTT